jgi:predicted aminopeptidase
MKLLTVLTLLSVFCLTGCATDGYYYQSSGGYYQRPSVSFAYSQSYDQPSYHSNRCRERVFVGPQYYKTFVDSPGPVSYKNYMNAPVVVERPSGSAVIVPRSWN